MLYELKCTNEECGHEYEEQIKLAEIEANGAKCPLCEAEAIREFRNNPAHGKHSSATTWRMGHGS